METTSFNLHQTLEMIGRATQAIVCHMLFDFALHGIILCAFLWLVSIYLAQKKYLYTKSIRRVTKRIFIFCLLLTIPGWVSLVIAHRLPDAGLFNFNSVGLLGFWSLICVHLVFEEMNNCLVKEKKVLEPKGNQ